MYLHILKRDLKRKKTMNCIILLFVILSAMFFSSSVNNIISVMGGVDRFMNMAGMKDYVAIMTEPDGEPLGDLLDESDSIKSWSRENALLCSTEDLTLNGGKLDGVSGMSMIVPAGNDGVRCFDKNNAEITEVPRGKVMVTSWIADKQQMQEGDLLTFDSCGTRLTLEVAGICKDAVLGSEMIASPRFIINPADFQTLCENEDILLRFRSGIYLIETDDTREVDAILKNVDGCRVNATRSVIKLTYILNISIAAIIMAVSVFLIVISFVVLRFTIGFTITEEFREIGVMKAIGIRNSSIRGLYLVKYFGIAVLGSVIGFFAGIPFGKLLLDSVSRSMVLGNDHPVLIGLVSAAAVVGMIVLFCWSCTAKIKKLSPIDAVRSGQTGERFHKNNGLQLGKSRLGATGFLSLNDVVSAPKQTAILTVVFTLCTILVMILSNTAQTLASDKLLFLISVTDSDVYLNRDGDIHEIVAGTKTLETCEADIEQILADNGMPGTVYTELMYNTTAEKDGRSSTGRFFLCRETKADEYVYAEGTGPQYDNEVALGTVTADEIGASVGDTITITVNGETDDYIVSGLFDSMSNIGRCGRFCETKELPDTAVQCTMAYQILFDDQPGDALISERIEKLKDIFGVETIFDKAGYVNDCTKAADALTGAKNLTMIVSLLIILMMSVLLERTFISKEKSEIALMKAIGFKSRSVIGVHVLRFVIITAVSVLIAALLSSPATKLIMDPLFGMMGAVRGITYAKNPLETFVIFPTVVFAAVMAGTFFTALSMGAIKASDTANIE